MNDYEEAAALLERAAARLDATGWTRAKAGGLHGPNCISGAISWENESDSLPLRSLAQRAVRAVLGTPSVVAWNDWDCPDGAAAADALRSAAKWLAGHASHGD